MAARTAALAVLRHRLGQGRVVLALVFGRRTNAVCRSLPDKLAAFNITPDFTDDWASYCKLIRPTGT